MWHTIDASPLSTLTPYRQSTTANAIVGETTKPTGADGFVKYIIPAGGEVMQVTKMTLECPDSWDGEPTRITVQVSRDRTDEVPAEAIGTLLMKAFKESGVLTCGWPDAFCEAIVQSAEHEEDFWAISDKFSTLVDACTAYLEERDHRFDHLLQASQQESPNDDA